MIVRMMTLLEFNYRINNDLRHETFHSYSFQNVQMNYLFARCYQLRVQVEKDES